MADHKKANAHLAAAAKHSKAGNAQAAQRHAFFAARALSSTHPEPDADDMGGPSDHDADNAGNTEDSAMGDGHFIQGAIKHPGALHKSLGVPQGQKIPEKKIEKAAHSSNPTLAKRANLAMTLKRLRGK